MMILGGFNVLISIVGYMQTQMAQRMLIVYQFPHLCLLVTSGSKILIN